MANKPTKAEYEGFKKAVANPMTPAPIKQKLQSIIDQYSSEYEGGSETPKAEPKSRAGRKPSTPRATKKTATPRATKKTATDIEKAKAQIKAKTGKTEEECEAIIEQYRALRTKAQEGKRKAEQATATNKKRVAKLEDKGDLIEGTNVKTADAVIETTAQDVAEKIEQQIEAVEEKAEKEAVAEVAKDNTKKTPTQKKQAVEAKVEKKVKEKTKVIVKKVVIDTTALLTSIATSLGKFDKDSQKEFLIKLRSDIDKLLAKYAFGGMTDGATQVMNVQQSNLSASSVNPTMFANGGEVEDFSEFDFQVGDKLDLGSKGIKYFKQYDGEKIIVVDSKADLKTSKGSSTYPSSVKKVLNRKFAKGGGVDGGAKIRIDSVDIDVYEDSYEEGEGRYVNGYSTNDLVGKLVSPKKLVSFLSKELYTTDYPSNYSIMDGAIFTSQLVDEDSGTATERQKAEWKKGNLTLYSENYRIGVSIIHPTETTDEELSELTGIGLYEKGGKVKMSSKFAKGGRIYALVDKFDANKQVYDQVYYKTNNYNEIIGYIADLKNEGEYDSDMQLIEVSSNGRMRKFDSSMLETGGVVGQEIVFDYNGEENTGVIKEITNLGDYVVRADNGRTLLAQRDMDVISLGAMRQQGVEQRKKRFGFFEDGGEIEEKGLYPIKNFTKVVNHYNSGKQWDLEEYPPYSGKGTIKEWMGEYPTNLEDAKAFIFESHPDWASEYEEEINDAKDNEELQDILYENDCPLFKMDNTYNSDWWGGVVQTGVLQADEDGYSGALVFVQFHRGGDVRGNYGEVQAFILNSFYEDFPLFASNLTYTIETNRGDVILDTQDFEGYTLLVVEDATGNFEEGEDVTLDELSKTFDLRGYSLYARGGGIKDVIVYDNNRETFDRYTIFTPDGSVYGMSDNPLMPNGFNMYIGDNTEIEKGSHLGKKLKSVPETIKIAVERRMSEEYAKGGLTEHGLRVGDRIEADGEKMGYNNTISVLDDSKRRHIVNLDKGERSRAMTYKKGGKLWIDTKGKGGLKGVKPSRKNTFRNEAVKRNMTSGQLATKVLASPSRYKGINPRSAQLVKNMGVRKQGGSIGDILRNRRGE